MICLSSLSRMAVLRIFWQTIRHINLQGYIYVWSNILWVILSLPIVTAPAAWAGLIHVSHKAQTQPRVSVEDFWDGFKANFWRSLLIGVATVVILWINLSNLIAYPPQSGIMSSFMRAIWISAILLWCCMMLYVWALLEEMEDPNLLVGLRNAGLMVLKNPFFTLGILLGIAALAALSTVFFPAWLLLTGSSIATLTTNATLDRLRAAGHPSGQNLDLLENLPE